MFGLTREPIDLLASSTTRERDGALCLFVGVVRNENGGRAVRYLEYEAYEEMALQQLAELESELLERFPVTEVRLVHRLGRLAIGEASVLVAVSSPHRAEAFLACRHGIDTLKARVPIWKKEFYLDGSAWIDGQLVAEAERR